MLITDLVESRRGAETDRGPDLIVSKKIKMKNGDKTMRTRKNKGFTLVEIMIVVAIIGLLAAIAIPSFLRARTTSQQNSCVNNLRQIDGAKDVYALENNNATPGALTALVSTYIKRTPVCPANGTYNLNALTATPTCSIGSGHAL